MYDLSAAPVGCLRVAGPLTHRADLDVCLGARPGADIAHLARHSVTGGSALTTAELRVLHYLPTNLSLAEIGTRLYVSRYTVKTHCGSIYRKLDVGSRSEVVDEARNLGLLDNAGGIEVG